MTLLGEFRHLCLIIRVFFNYGLDELVPNVAVLRIICRLFFWLPNRHKDKPLGERLRLALQQLGPVWIKFGQMMSTRRDLFSAEIADQLTLLQDRVTPFDGRLARQCIESAMGAPLATWFDDFDQQALASASIAQVHRARLKSNGQEVVLKVIRPNIRPMIKADIRLMYRLAKWIPKLLPDSRRLRPYEVVKEYEKTLFDELNLLREAANAIQLRRNFKNSSMLYIPKVYSDLCRENVLVMERIYGIPVSDITALEQNGTNMKLLAERGVQVFFTQVFRDNFFHADMHPGNIFVSYQHPQDPLYIGIDFGIVGALNKADKRYLAENFVAFFNRDYQRVAELHLHSGWVPDDTNVEDFEFAIRTLCEPIFAKPLAEISFGHLLLNLFNTARRFNMEIQPQLVLLQKTLLYIEGLGRQLYPKLDLWATAKPFLENWLRDQSGPCALLQTLKQKIPLWAEKFPELPELVYDSLQQHKKLRQSLDHLSLQLKKQQRQGKARYLLNVGVTLLVSGMLLQLIGQREALSIGLIVVGMWVWIVAWKRV